MTMQHRERAIQPQRVQEVSTYLRATSLLPCAHGITNSEVLKMEKEALEELFGARELVCSHLEWATTVCGECFRSRFGMWRLLPPSGAWVWWTPETIYKPQELLYDVIMNSTFEKINKMELIIQTTLACTSHHALRFGVLRCQIAAINSFPALSGALNYIFDDKLAVLLSDEVLSSYVSNERQFLYHLMRIWSLVQRSYIDQLTVLRENVRTTFSRMYLLQHITLECCQAVQNIDVRHRAQMRCTIASAIDSVNTYIRDLTNVIDEISENDSINIIDEISENDSINIG